MKLEDFKMLKGKLKQEYVKNKNALKQLESKVEKIRKSRKYMNFEIDFFVPLWQYVFLNVAFRNWFMSIVPVEIISICCIVVCFGMWNLPEKLLGVFFKKEDSLYKNKNELELVKESIKCEIKEQQLLCKNELLKSMVQEFNYQEKLLKEFSDKYYFVEKRERIPFNELKYSIKNKENLLRQKEVVLDELVKKNKLNDIFNNNKIKLKDILLYLVNILVIEGLYNSHLIILDNTINVGLINFIIPFGIGLSMIGVDCFKRKNTINAIKRIDSSLIREIEQNEELDFSDELEQVFDEVMNLRMELEEDKINLDFRQKAESFLSKDKDNNFSYSYNPNNSLEVIDVSLYKKKNNSHLTKKRLKEDSVKNT